MKWRENRILYFLLILITVGAGIYLVLYYWFAGDSSTITFLPVNIKLMAITYIILQVLKRYLFSIRNWWDWLYYIGLISITIPALIDIASNEGLFLLLTKIGTIMFVLQPLFDMFQSLNERKS